MGLFVLTVSYIEPPVCCEHVCVIDLGHVNGVCFPLTVLSGCWAPCVDPNPEISNYQTCTCCAGTEWENNLREYTAANPDLKVIDDIECIRMVRNRSTMLSIIGQEGIVIPRPIHSRTSSDSSMSSNGNLSDRLPSGSQPLAQSHNIVDNCSTRPSHESTSHLGTCVLSPVQVTLPEETEIEEAETLLQDASLSYPLLVKPQWADGRQEAHMLALVRNRAALGALLDGSQHKGLRPPLVVQQFIEHGDILHKVCSSLTFLSGDGRTPFPFAVNPLVYFIFLLNINVWLEHKLQAGCFQHSGTLGPTHLV